MFNRTRTVQADELKVGDEFKMAGDWFVITFAGNYTGRTWSELMFISPKNPNADQFAAHLNIRKDQKFKIRSKK